MSRFLLVRTSPESEKTAAPGWIKKLVRKGKVTPAGAGTDHYGAYVSSSQRSGKKSKASSFVKDPEQARRVSQFLTGRASAKEIAESKTSKNPLSPLRTALLKRKARSGKITTGPAKK